MKYDYSRSRPPGRKSWSIRISFRLAAVVIPAVLFLAVLAAGVLTSQARAYSNPSTEEIRNKLYEAAVERNIPPEILYGIAYQESGWRQFDSSGDPIISFDGGIGIMQVTSYGSYDVERLKTDIDYNIMAGASILINKWNNTPSIGDDAMNCYENWFYAVWAYNGWVANNAYPYTVWAHIADGRDRWAGVPVTAVPQGWLVNGLGVKIATPQPAHFWTPPLETYFSWYDGVYSSNWVLVANPATAGASVVSSIKIAGSPRSMAAIAGQSPGVVPAGNALASSFPGQMGGPVLVNTSRPAIISQRVIFGSSIEEVVGTPAERLSSHYYWTWYDMESPGFANWVLIVNPNDYDIFYRISLAGTERGSGVLTPGQAFTPTLAGEIGGPLEVEAWTDETMAAPAKVVASQRVLSGYGNAFNEAPGIPAEDLSNSYIWPWFDGIGGRNWILLANPNQTPVGYQIEIGTGGCGNPAPAGTACQSGTLAAAGDPGEGDIAKPEFPGIRTGPVRVTTQGGNVIASQRVTFGPSFGETAGYPTDRLSGNYHWTWYDQLSPGMKNWILVANPGPEPVTYTIRINGTTPAGYANRTLAPGAMETPQFPGWRSGPVEVVASGNVIASQRVLFNGYFNEVTGAVLD